MEKARDLAGVAPSLLVLNEFPRNALLVHMILKKKLLSPNS